MTSREKAIAGLTLLKEAIVGLLEHHPKGLRNAEIAEELDLRSDYLGSQKDYLSWSVLGLLLNAEVVVRKDNKRYVLAPQGDAANKGED